MMDRDIFLRDIWNLKISCFQFPSITLKIWYLKVEKKTFKFSRTKLEMIKWPSAKFEKVYFYR